MARLRFWLHAPKIGNITMTTFPKISSFQFASFVFILAIALNDLLSNAVAFQPSSKAKNSESV